ncbi:response regulator transcription factor [Pseudomonas sp. BN411]|nr:response regulator transcription factor [Pseudomonas sp. BN411]
MGHQEVWKAADVPTVLTLARESAVLQLIAEGKTNLRIAEELRISFKTVSTYKAHPLEKLDVSSNVEPAEIARRNGLVVGPAFRAKPTRLMKGLLQKYSPREFAGS